MNKKINMNLNIIELSSFVLSLLFMGIYLMPNDIILVRPLLFLLGAILGFTFISIELFLLLIMNNKYRMFYIGYMIIGIILAIIINTKIPYSAFLVIVLFSIVKDILRIKLVDKIYVGSRYKKYSKMFTTEYKEIKNTIDKVFNRHKVMVPVEVKTKRKSKSKSYLQKDLV